jgi:hypothetical protein
MEKTNFLLAMTKSEKQALQKIASQFGYSLSEYMRKKLFNENTDLLDENERYTSAPIEKHNVISINLLLKLIYYQREFLKQCYEQEELEEMDKKILEYSRAAREQHGYKVIKKNSKHE